MPVIGSAEVLVRPTFPGLQKEVRKALEGVGVDAGQQGGRRLGETLRTWGRRGAVLAGGAVAAGLGAALTTGFSRLTALEDAEAMLRGLGHSAQDVEGIMADVAAATEGTAIRMDEAAGTAAQMVAAGIEPGQELQATLRLVADAATIAGGDMQGMSAIFAKTAASNRLSMEEVNQLLDRGIPVFQALADEMGVTQGAVREMVSNGEVDFETFSNAMENTLGGSAEQAGSTMRGALANMGAYLARVGASLLEGVFPAIKDAVNAASEWLNGFEDEAKAIGEAIGSWLTGAADAIGNFIQEFRDGEGAGGKFREVVERVRDVISGLFNFITGTAIPAARDLFDWMVKQQNWLIPIAAGIGAMVLAWKAYKVAVLVAQGVTNALAAAQRILNAVMRMNPIGIIITVLIGLGAALVTAYQKSETFRNVVNGVWAAIKGAVKAVWEWLRDKVFKPLVQWFKDMGDRGVALKDGMVGAWNAMKDALGRAWNWIYQNVIQRFIDGVRWLQNQFKLRVNQVVAVWNGIKSVFRAVYNWVKQRVFDAFRTAANNLRNNFNNVVQRIKDIWSGIKSAFRAVKDWVVRNVINKFKDSFDSLLSKVRTIRDRIGDAWRGIANKFRRPINWVINRVWNDGIAKAFNSAASAIGISTRLPDEAAIPAFAKGGYHKGGWALVGEEGPELVNFSQPGQVYTAKQTREIMNSGPVGDLKDDLAAALGSTAGSLAGVTVGGAVEGLKAAAAAVLNPLKSLISNTVSQWGRFGRLGGGVGTRAIDEVLKWVGKKEDAELAKTTGSLHGGTAPGSGAWRRPSRGPITSGYGPRWGSFHAGIDVAGGGPTYAAAAGRVYRVGSGILGGRTGIGIGISHGGGVFTYYGHNPVGGPRVRPGQRVQAGQHIGYQGATGNVTGTHLHFELHRGGWGRHVNPRALGVFDQGGMLAPGAMAINLGSKPEPVLTPGQWDTLKAAATNAPGLSAKEQYRALYEGARDGVASGFSGGTRTTRTYARQGGF